MVSLPCSLRVAVLGVVIIVFFFVVVLVFLFVLVGRFSNADLGDYPMTRRIRAGACWMDSAHAQWYSSIPLHGSATVCGALSQHVMAASRLTFAVLMLDIVMDGR